MPPEIAILLYISLAKLEPLLLGTNNELRKILLEFTLLHQFSLLFLDYKHKIHNNSSSQPIQFSLVKGRVFSIFFSLYTQEMNVVEQPPCSAEPMIAPQRRALSERTG